MSGRFVSTLGMIAIMGGLLGLGAASATAQCLANEIQKLTASDATPSDHFGTSVAMQGQLAVIGARNGGDRANSGAAYVYRFDPGESRWIEEQRLVALDAGAQDEFGFPVAVNPVDPTLIIVGARLDDDACPKNVWCQSGSAYIFRFDPDTSTWAQEQKLTASDGDSQDQFGIAVAIWGDTAMVGAYLDDGPNVDGSAYVFRYDEITETWVEQQKLIPSDWQFFPRFGWSVSLEGDVAVIGAPTHSEQASAAGAAYVYRFDHDAQMWIEDQKLQASDPAEFNLFGVSVSLSGDTVLIGATFGDAPGVFNSGAAYIFQFNGKQWIEQQKLTASDGGFSDQFGRSVSLSGQTAIIGALLDDDVGNASGSAYIFTEDAGGWIEQAKLHSSDTAASDLFGASVAIDQDRALVGATHDDDDGSESGSAYIFGGLSDCNQNGTIDICDIADGFSTDDNNNGIPDECEPPPCPWDLDNTGTVGVPDLLSLLASWGPCPPKADCPADFDGDGAVGVPDLLELLANWGPCP